MAGGTRSLGERVGPHGAWGRYLCDAAVVGGLIAEGALIKAGDVEARGGGGEGEEGGGEGVVDGDVGGEEEDGDGEEEEEETLTTGGERAGEGAKEQRRAGRKSSVWSVKSSRRVRIGPQCFRPKEERKREEERRRPLVRQVVS